METWRIVLLIGLIIYMVGTMLYCIYIVFNNEVNKKTLEKLLEENRLLNHMNQSLKIRIEQLNYERNKIKTKTPPKETPNTTIKPDEDTTENMLKSLCEIFQLFDAMGELLEKELEEKCKFENLKISPGDTPHHITVQIPGCFNLQKLKNFVVLEKRKVIKPLTRKLKVYIVLYKLPDPKGATGYKRVLAVNIEDAKNKFEAFFPYYRIEDIIYECEFDEEEEKE